MELRKITSQELTQWQWQMLRLLVDGDENQTVKLFNDFLRTFGISMNKQNVA